MKARYLAVVQCLCLTLGTITSQSCKADQLPSSIPNSTNQIALSWTQEPSSKIAPSLLLDSSLWEGKKELQESIAFSLKYLESPRADEDYNRLAIKGIGKDRVLKSVQRFEALLSQSSSYQELADSISGEFILVKPQSNSVDQAVKFTGYFQPTYNASRVETAKYKYPIFKMPEDFVSWPKPQPKRAYLEGYSGRGNKNSPLKGQELAYLATRWEAFMIHVQGSAILKLEDGSDMAVGFAGATDYPFRGVSKGFLQEHNIAWTQLGSFFSKSPDLLNEVLVKNNRFIFFKENPNPLPVGSLGVPVIAERSIATDKSLMPPGALSVVNTKLPLLNAKGGIDLKPGLRFVLDQDTGSAIKGPARVDIFMGTGPTAQRKANAVFSKGDLYYLLLR